MPELARFLRAGKLRHYPCRQTSQALDLTVVWFASQVAAIRRTLHRKRWHDSCREWRRNESGIG